tara:strand:- start:557 stop:1039 length:483 start_codon:yes stop_codon:yes gene_type:complete
MKKLLTMLFAMTIVIVMTAQDNHQKIDLNVNNSNSMQTQMEQGVYSNKDGTITVVEVGASGFVSLKTLDKRADKTMVEYAERNKINYKFISATSRKAAVWVYPKVSRTYQILNSDGSKLVTKEMAINRIKEYNELLKLNVLTQEEYDNVTKEFKEILLNN